MTDRGYAVLLFLLFALAFAPMLMGEYGKGQCRIEAIKAGVEADKINQACGIK